MSNRDFLTQDQLTKKAEEFKSLLLLTERKGIQALIKWLEETDFFTAPASCNYHGNYTGGLLDHSIKTYRILSKLCQTFKRLMPEQELIISALLHDICKADFYKIGARNRKNETTQKWESIQVYEIANSNPIGHGAKSIILAQNYITFTEFELYSIYHHMGLPTEYSAMQDYNKAMEKCPNMLLLQCADNMSSHLFETTVKV